MARRYENAEHTAVIVEGKPGLWLLVDYGKGGGSSPQAARKPYGRRPACCSTGVRGQTSDRRRSERGRDRLLPAATPPREGARRLAVPRGPGVPPAAADGRRRGGTGDLGTATRRAGDEPSAARRTQ